MSSEQSMAEYYEDQARLEGLDIEQALEHDLSTWYTKGGRSIPIREMDDDHLLNAERFLRGDGGQPVSHKKRGEGYRQEKLQRLRNELSRRALSRLPRLPMRAEEGGWDPSSDQGYITEADRRQELNDIAERELGRKRGRRR